MNDHLEQDKEPEQGTDSGGAVEVGRRLKQAREKADIDINELAARLRLTTSQLAAIEAGQLDVFSAPIYVRGYVGNYARMVGLKPNRLIAMLPDDREEPPLTAATAVTPGHRFAENLARVATYAVGTVVLALPIIWWASEGSLDALLGSPAGERTVAAAADDPGADAAVDEPEEEAGQTPARPADDQPLMASMAMVRSNRQAAAPAESEPAAGESAADEEPAEPAPAPAPELVLEMRADSWVEVRDAAGKRLEYDLLQEGATHRYQGAAPYQVLIGNAEAVLVRYNDAPFDLTPHVQGNLARFEVGEAPAGG